MSSCRNRGTAGDPAGDQLPDPRQVDPTGRAEVQDHPEPLRYLAGVQRQERAIGGTRAVDDRRCGRSGPSHGPSRQGATITRPEPKVPGPRPKIPVSVRVPLIARTRPGGAPAELGPERW